MFPEDDTISVTQQTCYTCGSRYEVEQIRVGSESTPTIFNCSVCGNPMGYQFSGLMAWSYQLVHRATWPK